MSELLSYEDRLHHLDLTLYDRIENPLSLNPDKDKPSSYLDLGKTTIDGSRSRHFYENALSGLKEILESQIENFPENIYWDCDYYFTLLFEQQNSSELLKFCRNTVQLMNAYGRHSEIRFQFVHDFSYGFDWARWVRKNPGRRQKTGPFDPEFLDYLCRRSCEIVDLIKKNDAKYHPLKKGQIRNPFNFRRDPEGEKLLLNHLAKQNLIPVTSWCKIPRLNWQPDYTSLREQVMTFLNLKGEPEALPRSS